MKRDGYENREDLELERSKKKRIISREEAKKHFRPGLFEDTILDQYRLSYQSSIPYKHGVITDLLSPDLLRNVRNEISTNISFSEKETDIYKIYQSGDLANLDGLDDSSLKLLPSLVTLRDALYSLPFREYLSSITKSGPLSGIKTDMAVNIYTPGCHLLCHDDVIGSRRVSYILYLTDADTPWKPEWGGALRLYPTENLRLEDGTEAKVPSADPSRSIPPAFNQLSFFAVQPGESFHDVEEVYAATGEDDSNNDGRVRMAISGWFHIPQEGEDGYEEGAEARHVEMSSLAQLQRKSDSFDLPQLRWIVNDDISEKNVEENDHDDFNERDFDFLSKFMNPNFLIPDTVSDMANVFSEEQCLPIEHFLSPKMEVSLRQALVEAERSDQGKDWPVSRPPHKHRFQFKQPSPEWRSSHPLTESLTLVYELINDFFPSVAFRKWLQFVTGLSLGDCNVLARRFRKGVDYTLATAHNDADPRLEITLSITPWAKEELDQAAEIAEEEDRTSNGTAGDDDRSQDTSSEQGGTSNVQVQANGEEKSEAEMPDVVREAAENAAAEGGVGGYEVYMLGEEDDEDDDDKDNDSSKKDHGVTIPSSHTGAGKRREKADPAIYKSGSGDGDDDEDNGILFSMSPTWNTLSIVLRDKGCLRFTKYLSRSAPGDRWDVIGEWKVENDEEGEEDGETESME